MSEPFLICGLPRSRTAWLSVAATTAKSICYHEPTPHLGSFEELKTLWSDDRFAYVGMSDSALSLQLGRILAEVSPKVLLVKRPVEDVIQSFCEYMSGSDMNFDHNEVRKHCEFAFEELDKFWLHPNVSWVDYEDLNKIDVVRSALQWLMPKAKFPKLEDLMHMNIQVDREWLLKLVMQPHTGWHLDASWNERARA